MPEKRWRWGLAVAEQVWERAWGAGNQAGVAAGVARTQVASALERGK